MKKRAIALIIVFIMALSVFSGCTLFEHNYERDYARVVATVQPVTIEWNIKDENGSNVLDPVTNDPVKDSYTSELYKITKRELINSYANNSSSYQNATREEALNDLLDQLIKRHLYLVQAKARLKQGTLIVFNRGKANEKIYTNINDSLTDTNAIWKSTYAIINNQIFLLGNEVLSDLNEEERVKGSTEEQKTSFPVMPDYDAPEAEDIEDTEVWVPDILYAPELNDYLYQEATARLVRLLIDRVGEDKTLTKEEKNLLKADEQLLKSTLAEENGKYKLYFKLKEFFCVKKFIYEGQEEVQLINRLRESVVGEAEISEDRIQKYYNTKLSEQKTSFKTDSGAFATALDGDDPVFYYNESGYYYVKHILIPFSEEQTAMLENKQAEEVTDAEIKAYREGLASGITGFARVNGENTGAAISFKSIYNEILSVVNSQTSMYYKEREFDRLMYKYNTDTGIFSKAKGYLVKPSGNNYVDEFQKAVEKLYEDKVVGALSEPVLTQFGYHIIYLSSIVEQGKEFSLFDYQTAARYKDFYTIIKEILQTEEENKKLSTFEASYIDIYHNDEDLVKIYESRYKDLY